MEREGQIRDLVNIIHSDMARILIQQDDLDKRFRKLEMERNALERELEALNKHE